MNIIKLTFVKIIEIVFKFYFFKQVCSAIRNELFDY